MELLSLNFFLLFAGALLLYYILPGRCRSVVLLSVSALFIAAVDIRSLAPLAAVILISYFCGRYAGGHRALKKAVTAVCVVFVVIMMFAGKRLSLIGGVGLSFYSLEAIGYMIDCCVGRYEPEKDPVDYALFLSLFCKFVSGPIERGEKLFPQIKANKKKRRREIFSLSDLRDGLILIVWGAFLKLVIANRAAILVDAVYSESYRYGASALCAAAVCYSIQLYCDFSGYSAIASGTAAAFGLKLTDNFAAPYLSSTMREFWRRWHVSLSSWLKDYIYIPLGGSRKGRARKAINLVVTFAVSGLWHGFGATFFIWGLIHGVCVAGEDLLRSLKKNRAGTGKDGVSFGRKFAGMAVVFAIVTTAWIFFRSDSSGEAVSYIVRVFTRPDIWLLSYPERSIFAWGLSAQEILILLSAVLLLMAVDILQKRKGSRVDEWLAAQWPPFRVLFVLALLMTVIVFGEYGVDFDSSVFIYGQF